MRRAVAQPLGLRPLMSVVDPTCPPPTLHAPTLWRLDLTPPTTEAELVILGDDERTHAARLRFEADRRAYLNAHLALRGVLAGLLGVEPGALRFGRGPHGKPSLPGSDLAFNLSHSGPVGLLVAGSSALEWGIDIERIRPLPDALAVARRVFTPAEQEALWREPPDHQSRAFMTLWTRKEACLKALGTGLTVEPAGFEVGLVAGPGHASRDAARHVRVPLADGRTAQLHCIDLDLGLDLGLDPGDRAGNPAADPLAAAVAWTATGAAPDDRGVIGC